MPQIVPAGQLNTLALGADDLYISIVNPPSFIRGVPTDVFGVIGSASWGKVNTPTHMGSGQDAVQQFGPISAQSLTDPYDIATDLALCFGQAGSGASIEGWGVRVTDGTDIAAVLNINSGVATPVENATVGGTISASETFVVNATITAGPTLSAQYVTGASDTTTTIAAGLAAAINSNPLWQAQSIQATSTIAVAHITYPAADTIAFSDTVTGGGGAGTLTLAAGTSVNPALTLTSVCTGVLGNQTKIAFAAGAQTATTSVTVTGFTGVTELYPNLSNVNFWQNLSNALLLGLSTIRGPSQWVVPSGAVSAGTLPTLPYSGTLASGTDGRAGVNAALLVGSDTSNPRTGIFALRALNPAVGVAWITGLTQASAAASLLALGQTEAISVLFPFATGTTTAAAVTAAQTNGIQDPSFAYVKDWVYFFDTTNNVTRLVAPTAVIAGTIVSLQPQFSPGNQPTNLIFGTERNPPFTTGNLPYTPSEIAQLEAIGCMLITNPIPAGNQFGVRHGQTTSNNPATQPFEYWRMTAYLARSFAQSMGVYVNQLQSQQPDDPLRRQVRNVLNTFLGELEGAGQIDGYLVTCLFSTSPSAQPGLGMNTPASVSQHFLYALCQVTYLASVRFFILSLQGGTTVVTVAGNLSSQVVGGA